MAFEGGAVARGAPGAAAGPKPGYRQAFEALKHRNYRILWIAQAFSFMGMQMQQIARGLLAYQLTGSYAGMGIVLMGWGISQLVFGLFGGAVADRVNKRSIIVVAQAGTGILCLVTATSITFGFISVELLFATGVAQGTLFAFNMPARQALVAELVPPPVLMNAIALNNVVMNATRIIGPAVAGLVIALGDGVGGRGIEAAYYLQAAMYLGVLSVLIFLPPSYSHLEGAATRRGIFSEIGAGLSYTVKSRVLLQLMLLAFVSTLVGMPYMTLLPGFAVGELGVEASAFGIMSSVTGIGAIVGSLFIATMSEHPRKPLLQMLFGLGFGAGLIGLGLGSMAFGYVGALVALLAVGLFATSFQTINNTMLMAETKPEYYGRVMSVYMLTFALFPLMSYPLGVLADAITASATFTAMGVLIAGVIAIISVLTPRWTFGRSRPPVTAVTPEELRSASPQAVVDGRAAAPVFARGAVGFGASALVAAGDAAGPPREPSERRRAPRSYMGAGARTGRPLDYMGGMTSDAPGAHPIARLTSAPREAVSYGLGGRASVVPSSRGRAYGLDAGPPLRAVRG